MQLTEARVFELMGRLHAENRALAEENERLRAAVAAHRCPEPAPPAEGMAAEEAPKAPRRKAT